MSKVQLLRALVNQRLTAAAEEIIGLFERTIAEYEEELCRSKEENERQRKLLDTVFSPRVRLHRADVQQLLLRKEEVPPEQQEWSPRLNQEDQPEPPHIKEEEEELWSSQEGEQLQGLKEADINKFTFTAVPVKSEEDDEEKPQSSQLHQTQTEADEDDCGGAEPTRNSDPERLLQPDDKTEDLFKSDGSDEDWRRRKALPHSKTRTKTEITGSDMTGFTGQRQFLLHSCSECGRRFSNKTNMKVHMGIHTQEKPFSCLVCGRIFTQGENLRNHMMVHKGKERLRCTVCGRGFKWYKHFKIHKCAGCQSSQLHQR